MMPGMDGMGQVMKIMAICAVVGIAYKMVSGLCASRKCDCRRRCSGKEVDLKAVRPYIDVYIISSMAFIDIIYGYTLKICNNCIIINIHL